MKIKQNIFCMYAISLLQGMVFYGPIATLYRQNAGVTMFQITLIESISLVLMMALEIPWGVIADRIGYRKTMIVCTLLFFISKIIFFRADNFFDFLLERIILSIVISGLSGVDSSILYLSCTPDKSQQVFAIYQHLGTFGMLVASAIYAILIKDHYRLAAFLTIISYGISLLFAFGIQEVQNEKEENLTQGWQDLKTCLHSFMQHKKVIFFIIGIALVNETHQTITVFLNQLQYIKCGLSNQAIGYIYILVSLLGLLGCFSSKLTQCLKERNTLRLLLLSPFLSCLTLALTKNPIVSILAVIFIHLSYSFLQPLQLYIQNREITMLNRATALSLNAILMDSLAVVTNLMFGKMADIQLSYAMMMGAIFCMIGYLLCEVYERGKEIV